MRAGESAIFVENDELAATGSGHKARTRPPIDGDAAGNLRIMAPPVLLRCLDSAHDDSVDFVEQSTIGPRGIQARDEKAENLSVHDVDGPVVEKLANATKATQLWRHHFAQHVEKGAAMRPPSVFRVSVHDSASVSSPRGRTKKNSTRT